MGLNVSEADLKKYLFKFFGSLRQYPEKYLPLIFEQYNEPTKHLAYLCPLCLENYFYTENTMWHYKEEFSLDHFPPQNVGGLNKMLVCKSCNNTAGHSYESSFKERVLREGYNRKVPNIKLPAISNLENVKGWMHSDVSVNKDGSLALQLNEKALKRTPKLTEHQNATNYDGKGFKMNIQIPDLDNKKVAKAILKAAYLYCFDYWGYEFVFSFAGELFRNVIAGRSDYPINVPTLWYDNKAEIHKGIVIPTGMVFIQKPKEILSMFVNIPATIKEIDYTCIIPVQIPNPEDKDFKQLIGVQQFFDCNPGHQIYTRPMPFEFNLSFPQPYTKTWEELKKFEAAN
jgi:hypothetical protein